MTLKKDILDFLEKLSTEYDFDFSFDDDTDLVDILKAHNFKPNVDSDDLLTGLLDFIVLTNKYCSFEAYVLLSFHCYFDEEEIEKLKEIIIGIRNLRASSNVHPSKKTELIFVTTKYEDLINQSEGFLKKLGYSENIKVQENKEGIAQNALSIITDGIELYIPFEELVDIEEERKRMEEEKKKVIAEIERASKMLSNPGFVNKAPEAKINEEKAKLEKYQNMLKNLEERLK